jgi:hypothetical protein
MLYGGNASGACEALWCTGDYVRLTKPRLTQLRIIQCQFLVTRLAAFAILFLGCHNQFNREQLDLKRPASCTGMHHVWHCACVQHVTLPATHLLLSLPHTPCCAAEEQA